MFGLRKKIIDHLGVFFIGGLFHGKVPERHSVPARVYPSPTINSQLIFFFIFRKAPDGEIFP